ncbi:unnamed protein product [Linum trigynum]|uniref:EF-hand domain-containing protein n=1 Tax=Linum trigynum TaxID=586398 RepID=A0AAV2FCS8_9ROSI
MRALRYISTKRTTSILPSLHIILLSFHFHFMDNVALNFHGLGRSTRPVTLSEDQLHQIFMQFDANCDKRLCKEELKRAFSQLGAIIPGYRARRC